MSNTITLRQFKNKFYPTIKKDEDFSEAIGFNNSFINRILNKNYFVKHPDKAPRLVALKKFVYAKSGKHLILDNVTAEVIDHSNEAIRDLTLEISSLKQNNYEWKEVCTILAISLAARRTCQDREVYHRGKIDAKKFLKKFKINLEIGDE